jgi:hypothetical protein
MKFSLEFSESFKRRRHHITVKASWTSFKVLLRKMSESCLEPKVPKVVHGSLSHTFMYLNFELPRNGDHKESGCVAEDASEAYTNFLLPKYGDHVNGIG